MIMLTMMMLTMMMMTMLIDDDDDYDDEDEDDDDLNGNDNDYYYVGDICKFRGSCKKYEQNHDQSQPPSLLLDMSSAE